MLTAAEAIAELAVIRNELDDLQAQTTVAVRELLRPLGFNKKPEEWRHVVDDIIATLNDDYRHDTKVELKENSRKIGCNGGAHKLSHDLVEVTQLFEQVEQRLSAFKRMYTTAMPELTDPERARFDDALNTFSRSIEIYKNQLDTSRNLMATSWAAVRALDPSSRALAAIIGALDEDQDLAQVTVDVRLLLTRLSESCKRQAEFAERSGTLHLIVTASFMVEGPLPREEVDIELAKFAPIRQGIEAAAAEQAIILSELKAVFDAVLVPSVLHCDVHGTEVPVIQLRQAYNVFSDIRDAIDIMQELFEPLSLAVFRITTQLRVRLQLGIPNATVYTLF